MSSSAGKRNFGYVVGKILDIIPQKDQYRELIQHLEYLQSTILYKAPEVEYSMWNEAQVCIYLL
jgi:hypothetical protein